MDYENKKILGYEIEKRWNAYDSANSKLATEIIRQSDIHNIDNFDSHYNWLVRCVSDAKSKLNIK